MHLPDISNGPWKYGPFYVFLNNTLLQLFDVTIKSVIVCLLFIGTVGYQDTDNYNVQVDKVCINNKRGVNNNGKSNASEKTQRGSTLLRES